MVDFQGACNYVLSTDKCPGSNVRVPSFRIDAENIPCGSSGVTCTKSVTVTVHDTVIHVVRGKEQPSVQRIPLLSPIRAAYSIIHTGVYVVVTTPFGLRVIWDRGTRLYIELSPTDQYWSKVCGLCGNFDGDMTNDLTTKYGIEENSVLPFGDSWRVRADCPQTKEQRHPCEASPHRKPGAHKACAIIKSNTFAPCHSLVDPGPYYSRCVYDTCGCDMVGDCECTCEAVAAYAYECLAVGVAIDWRTESCGE